MPRYNVQNDNGEWACFSTIVDDFITEFMPREQYQKWREEEYGKHCGPLEKANIMDYHEALETVLCNYAANKGYDLEDLPEYSSPCDYCKFWNKERNKCEIVERKSEVILEDKCGYKNVEEIC